MFKADFYKINLQRKANYMPGLDVYRAFAILLGLFWHFLQIDSDNRTLVNILSSGPWGGANPLFVISGFLLGGQLFGRILIDKKPSIKNFVLRRILKTWPSYFAMIAVILFLGLFFSFENLPSSIQLLTFTQNFDLKNSFLSHTWSLCIEEHFYLVLSLAAFTFFSKPSLKKVSFIFLTVFLIQLVLRFYLWQKYLGTNGPDNFELYFNRIYYQTYCRIDGLLLGVYLAYFANFNPNKWKRILGMASELLPAGIFLCLIGFALQMTRTNLLATLLVYPFETFGFGFIMIYCLNEKSLVNKIDSSWITMIATLSYCLYLTHKPVFHLVDHFMHSTVQSFAFYLSSTFFVSLVCTFLAAYVLYIFIERPFLTFRERFKL